MTWKEFKDKVEEQGVKDDTEMGYIDWLGWNDPEVEKSEEKRKAVDVT